MKYSKSKIQNRRFIFCLLHLAIGVLAISAQSTSQSFPTPVTSGEISGAVRARDLGDARLTSYFYALDGRQGDIFINVVTKNFDGNIDVFTAGNLRPLTKIVIYSDAPESETGRVVYLRQPEKLILRIEGRTPDDNPATYRIKFAGSFAPLAELAETDESKEPEVKAGDESGVRVNSVGTIIEVKPKPTPAPVRETTARAEKSEPVKPVETEKSEPETAAEKTADKTEQTDTAEKTAAVVKPKTPRAKKPKQKPEVVVTENVPAEEKTDERAENNTEPETGPAKKESEEAKPKASKPVKPAKNRKTIDPSELIDINLVILFKDGTKIERSMSEVLKVGVDQGILTVIYKNGSIGRYSILEVAKMTIE